MAFQNLILTKGDPYHCYCHKTTRLMKEKFNKIEIQTLSIKIWTTRVVNSVY